VAAELESEDLKVKNMMNYLDSPEKSPEDIHFEISKTLKQNNSPIIKRPPNISSIY